MEKCLKKIIFPVVVCFFCISWSGVREPEISKYGNRAKSYRPKRGSIYYGAYWRDEKSDFRKIIGLVANDGTYDRCSDDEGATFFRVLDPDSEVTEDIDFSRIRRYKIIKENDMPKSEFRRIKDGSEDGRESVAVEYYWIELEIFNGITGTYDQKRYLIHHDLAIGWTFVDTGGRSSKFLYEIDEIKDIETMTPDKIAEQELAAVPK